MASDSRMPIAQAFRQFYVDFETHLVFLIWMRLTREINSQRSDETHFQDSTFLLSLYNVILAEKSSLFFFFPFWSKRIDMFSFYNWSKTLKTSV